MFTQPNLVRLCTEVNDLMRLCTEVNDLMRLCTELYETKYIDTLNVSNIKKRKAKTINLGFLYARIITHKFVFLLFTLNNLSTRWTSMEVSSSTTNNMLETQFHFSTLPTFGNNLLSLFVRW